jgi:hypothetical protein
MIVRICSLRPGFKIEMRIIKKHLSAMLIYPPTSIFYFTFLSKQSKSLISFYMAFHLVDIEGKVDEPADCGSNCPEEILHDGGH